MISQFELQGVWTPKKNLKRLQESALCQDLLFRSFTVYLFFTEVFLQSHLRILASGRRVTSSMRRQPRLGKVGIETKDLQLLKITIFNGHVQ